MSQTKPNMLIQLIILKKSRIQENKENAEKCIKHEKKAIDCVNYLVMKLFGLRDLEGCLDIVISSPCFPPYLRSRKNERTLKKV